MITLGINAAFHDCSACLVEDGVVRAAAEEERFTRVKHGKRPVPFTVWQLPWNAIACCLREAGLAMRDVDHVAYAYDPWLQLGERDRSAGIALPLEPSAAGGGEPPWEALGLAYVVNAPRQLAGGAPHHLRHLFQGIGHDGPYRWHYVEHHRAHEASAFLAAPFDECAVLVMDGRGERACTSYGVFEHGRYARIGQVDFPHSLGLLYESVTAQLGFLHSSDEYKVMALAPFGRPVFANQLRECVRYRGGGSYDVTEPDWRQLFGPPREPGESLGQRHMDIACSLQAVLEETVFALADWLHVESGSAKLAMAGGVALNCVLNGRLRARGPFAQVWVQPAAGDAGTALGAALWVDASERGWPARRWRMDHAFLGPAFDEREIEAQLRAAGLAFERPDDIAQAAAALLAGGKVLGWFQGRMEFGPRALGARSILASPFDPAMQDKLNQIKDREDFRPVAPAVLADAADQWFETGTPSPFMLFVDQVRADKAARIPAVCHVDGSARVQTVDAATNPALHALLQAFARQTGVPVLVNTSFNTRGEPIVCTPRDALAAFFTSPLDALAIGPFIVDKGKGGAGA
ncbi:carbamoyltransferase [Massilia agilis]|uniref:Carbamoyltransferase n=1 Tax=Massilia agilis TaxID=1811226 RepID=A0ABT2D782_9BURK|nr:carbamoyltransferase C-terminal domain-containing protein [Massilia agilis]MCS0807175.1 carbamoyltransferase [Massilia agilis]